MTRSSTKSLILPAALVGLSLPVAAQGVPANPQCETVMMVGPAHFSAEVLAACQPYFQALADGAIATNTFSSAVPRNGGLNVVASSSGN
ncbi:hypothetical protein [Hasllibacter sp. MH4015]|uniref:hypothetical protein n=1 Tax=Hasllibacter sp. MH4015 TaxID=2854029 RepID=UPI001CD290D8|nr:hypothetical protein [Hasllibacter sp. MH4015]